jgi:chromate reductase
MSYQPTILAFAGSARRDSFNKKLIHIAVRGAEAAGAKVTLVDLAEYPMPLYDQDQEATSGMPENGRRLLDLFKKHDGLMISSPEYNSSITPLLKNTLDWVSRKNGADAALTAFQGKTAILMSASPGALGGMRGLVHLRAILGNIGVIVLPEQRAVSQAGDAFDEQGNLRDAKVQTGVEGLGARLAAVLGKLQA